MIVLGIDPGPRSHGYAALDLLTRGVVRYVHHGITRATPLEALRAILAELRVDLVAVEVPEGYAYAKAREADLLATGVEAGAFREAARALGRPVATASAANWRVALLGRAAAGDGPIEAYIARRVQGWPGGSSVHTRDAAGVAIYLGEKHVLEQRLEVARATRAAR